MDGMRNRHGGGMPHHWMSGDGDPMADLASRMTPPSWPLGRRGGPWRERRGSGGSTMSAEDGSSNCGSNDKSSHGSGGPWGHDVVALEIPIMIEAEMPPSMMQQQDTNSVNMQQENKPDETDCNNQTPPQTRNTRCASAPPQMPEKQTDGVGNSTVRSATVPIHHNNVPKPFDPTYGNSNNGKHKQEPIIEETANQGETKQLNNQTVSQPQQNYPLPQQNYPQPQQNYPQSQQNYPQSQQNYPQPHQSYPQPQHYYPHPQQNYSQQPQNYSQQPQYYNQRPQHFNQQQYHPQQQYYQPDQQPYRVGFSLPNAHHQQKRYPEQFEADQYDSGRSSPYYSSSPHQGYQDAPPQHKQSHVRNIPIFIEGQNEPVINEMSGSPRTEPHQPMRPQQRHSQPQMTTQQQHGGNNPQRTFHPAQQTELPQKRRQSAPVDPHHQQSAQEIPIPIQVKQPKSAAPCGGGSGTSTPREASPQPQPRPPPVKLTPMQKIDLVRENNAEYFNKVQEFSGTKKDREFLYLDEMLTRALISLDDIDPDGNAEIRQHRKKLINDINAKIAELEKKASAGSAAAEQQQQSQTENVEQIDEKKDVEKKLENSGEKQQCDEKVEEESKSKIIEDSKDTNESTENKPTESPPSTNAE